MQEKSNIIVHTAICQSLDDKLTNLCTSTDRTKSYVVRMAIERLFKIDHKKANSNWARREVGDVLIQNNNKDGIVTLELSGQCLTITSDTFDCLVSAIKSI